MRKGSAETIVRRNITMPQSVVDRLERIKAQRGCQSDSEVVRNAINLFEAVLDQRVLIEEPDGTRHLLKAV